MWRHCVASSKKCTDCFCDGFLCGDKRWAGAHHRFLHAKKWFMKKHVVLCFAAALCSLFLSFSTKRGGDSFAIFLNGKQVLQQFVYADKSAKTLSLGPLRDNDKIEVQYSHCGRPGKDRVITITDEKNNLLKKLEFGDGENGSSRMVFYRRDITAKSGTFKLFYTAKELPEGRILATIVSTEGKVVAKL